MGKTRKINSLKNRQVKGQKVIEPNETHKDERLAQNIQNKVGNRKRPMAAMTAEEVAEQPLPKQRKNLRRKSTGQEDQNNNASIALMSNIEPVVGSMKSLINSIKKAKVTKVAKSKAVKESQNLPKDQTELNQDDGETAYQRLYRKIQENKKAKQDVKTTAASSGNRSGSKDKENGISGVDRIFVTVHAPEDDDMFRVDQEAIDEMQFLERSRDETECEDESSCSSGSSDEDDEIQLKKVLEDGEFEESEVDDAIPSTPEVPRLVKWKLTYETLKDKIDAGDMESLRQEPMIQELVEQMYEERAEKSNGNKSRTNKGREPNVLNKDQIPQIKSPSDTTIYAPALNKEIMPVKFCQEKAKVMDLSDQIGQFLSNIRAVSGDKSAGEGQSVSRSIPTVVDELQPCMSGYW